MKTDIHPNYQETTVVCSCGNTFVTRSTVESLHVELCNECHPFFTGKQKLVDSGGRVERFQKRYGRTTFTGRGGEPAKADRPAKPAKSSKSAEAPSEQPEAETAPEIEAAPEAADT